MNPGAFQDSEPGRPRGISKADRKDQSERKRRIRVVSVRGQLEESISKKKLNCAIKIDGSKR